MSITEPNRNKLLVSTGSIVKGEFARVKIRRSSHGAKERRRACSEALNTYDLAFCAVSINLNDHAFNSAATERRIKNERAREKGLLPIDACDSRKRKEQDLVEHGHEDLLREAGHHEGLFHMQTVRVELFGAATSDQGSLGQTFLVYNVGDIVQGITDPSAELCREAVLTIEHGQDKDRAIARDRHQLLRVGRKVLCVGGHCGEVCFF